MRKRTALIIAGTLLVLTALATGIVVNSWASVTAVDTSSKTLAIQPAAQPESVASVADQSQANSVASVADLSAAGFDQLDVDAMETFRGKSNFIRQVVGFVAENRKR